MAHFHSNALIGASGGQGEAEVNIQKSVRFNRADSAYLNRTPSSAGNTRTWTWSGWVKYTTDPNDLGLFAGDSASSRTQFRFKSHLLDFVVEGVTHRRTDAFFRDPSAWYHIVWAFDSTQSTASNRSRLYINGVEITDFSTNNAITQNATTGVNSTNAQVIGATSTTPDEEFDGYMTDVYLIDGQQLDCTSFGAFNDDGVWQPAVYSGVYGTNGFHLFDFANESGIGNDSSGNNNDFTVNNITTGNTFSTNMTPSSTAYPNTTLSNGGLSWSGNVGTNTGTVSSLTIPTNKKTYVEVTHTTTGGGDPGPGVGQGPTVELGLDTVKAWWRGGTNGSITVGTLGSFSGTNTTWSNGDILGIALDNTANSGAGSITFYKNGSQIHTGGSGWTSYTDLRFEWQNNGSGTSSGTWNYGASAFSYPVSGHTGLFEGAGANEDVLRDVPINGDASDDTGAGGELSSNYATLNPLAKGTSLTMTNGSLSLDQSISGWDSAYSTIFLPSGKWYAEFTIRGRDSTNSYGILVGLAAVETNIYNSEISSGDTYAVQNMGSMVKVNHNGGSTNIQNIGHYAVGDVLQLAYDADNGKLYFGRNNTWINSGNPSTGSNPTVSSISGNYCFAVALLHTGDKIDCNFGQRAWSYSAPTNFKAVCTSNLPDPSFAEGTRAFKATAYSGTGNTITIPTAFQPDLIWTKCRSTSTGHVLQDRVNGITTNYLQTQATDQLYGGTQGVTSTSATGYTLGTGGGVNGSSKTFRTWAWDAGSGTSTTTNTVGQRTSTIKVSQEAGISIVKWTGSNGNGATVGHGLNAAPEFIIAHNLGGGQWPCYTKSGGGGKYMYFNSDIDERLYSHFWGGQDPTSSVFTTGSDSDVTNGAIIAYCFTPIPGFSAMGYYSGNNSTDGPYINTGFAVAWLLTKNKSASGDWHITDIAGSTFNAANEHLASNSTNGESSYTSSGLEVDLLSNGFKIRGTGAARNGNEDAIFYLAFAANPFKVNGGLAR